MYLFEHEKDSPWNLWSCENRIEDGIVTNAKIQKVKNVEFLHIQKTYIGSLNQLSHTFCIVCTLCVCKKNIQRQFQWTSCIRFCIPSLYIFCIYKKHTFQVWSSFEYGFHIFCVCVEIWCTFLVHSLTYKILVCTIFVYKIHLNVVFCMIFIYALSSFCTNFC